MALKVYEENHIAKGQQGQERQVNGTGKEKPVRKSKGEKTQGTIPAKELAMPVQTPPNVTKRTNRRSAQQVENEVVVGKLNTPEPASAPKKRGRRSTKFDFV